MKKLTQNDFAVRIKQRFPTEDFSVELFNGLGHPTKIRCNNCNQIIEVQKASNFLAKNKAYGCKNCHGLWRQREKKLEQIKDRYEIISTFVKDTHTYYIIKCKKCGHQRIDSLSNLYRNLECGCITGVKRNRTEKEFLDEVNRSTLDGTYTLISPYVNQVTKILLKHSCGFIWAVRPGDVIHGRSFCPRCSAYESKGAKIVKQVLINKNINFEQEKRLDNSLQRFDFYFELNGHKIAIEYNGKQHYEEVPFFHCSLAQQQERDNRKKKYCKDNNIHLLIIPYTKKSSEIQQIICNYIDKFNDYPEREYIISD